jgi:ferredoxin
MSEATSQAEKSASDDLVRMVVDTESCIGAGQCEMYEPDVFLVSDDDVIAGVIGDGCLPRAAAIAVADRCPGRAISFVEIDEDEAAKSEPE